MESKTSSGDIGCLTVVGIVFVILKLLGVQPVCEWSWLWVLCPFWLPLAIGIGFMVCVGLFVMLIGIFTGKN